MLNHGGNNNRNNANMGQLNSAIRQFKWMSINNKEKIKMFMAVCCC